MTPIEKHLQEGGKVRPVMLNDHRQPIIIFDGKEVIVEGARLGQAYGFGEVKTVHQWVICVPMGTAFWADTTEEKSEHWNYTCPPNSQRKTRQILRVIPKEEKPERCRHISLVDTGVGYYNCPACNESWTHAEWNKNGRATTVKEGEAGRKSFERFPALANVILHAANHWPTDSRWSELLWEINKVCDMVPVSLTKEEQGNRWVNPAEYFLCKAFGVQLCPDAIDEVLKRDMDKKLIIAAMEEYANQFKSTNNG